MPPDRSELPYPPTATGEPDMARATLLWRVRGRGCPACAAQREAETYALGWFLLENYRELATLRALMSSRYCARHLTALVAKREPKLSVTLEFLVREEVGILRRFREELRRRRWVPWRRSNAGERRLPRHARPADRPSRCPLCDSGSTAATVAVEEVLSLLETNEGRSAYAASDGLCGPHGWMALRDAPARIADCLAADLERRLRSIGVELDRYYAYQRGRDDAYAHSNTWVRALHLVWGDTAGNDHDFTNGAEAAK